MTRRFRYPQGALASCYARGGIGLALSAGPLILVQPAPAAAWVLAAAAALFLVYFARTVCRSLTFIELDEAGIRASGPLGASIRWEELRALQLEYYSTRRDREEGWMQLKLRAARRTIRVDSDLAEFAELARAAAGHARRRGLAIDESTRNNLSALRAA